MTIDISDQTGGRSLEEAQSVIAAGHPPMAEGIILCDWDSTIQPFGFLFSFPPPLPGAVDVLQKLAALGYQIIIFTSRLSPSWLASVDHTADQHIHYIKEYCERYDIPMHGVTGEKIPSVLILDDKAIRVTNWKQVKRDINKILGVKL